MFEYAGLSTVLVRLAQAACVLEDPRRYSKYPCRREGGLFWPDGSKADLHLKDDQTVRIRSCGFPKAHPEIDRGAVYLGDLELDFKGEKAATPICKKVLEDLEGLKKN